MHSRISFPSLPEALQLIEVPKELPVNTRFPEAAQTGLLIRAGDWEGAHNLAQNIPASEGSFWHGILHRLEGDPGNAAYWFRKTGRHPIFPALRTQAEAILATAPDVPWRLPPEWDPFQFIEWCEEAHRYPAARERIAVQLQAAEWSQLFFWCIAC